ncbi:MAG: protein kinase [Myxococcota bacterium]|nr:protein kinase [Myxococcota bacterium]
MTEENQKEGLEGLPYGRYLIRKRVARGGMGEVFLADQLGPTGQAIRPVALKRMLPRIARKPHAAKMFLEEMATAAQLNHPNIATTYDFGEVDGTYFFAMEYLQGLSLSQLLQALGALPVSHTVHICLKVLEALNHAHQRKTISGTIAPVVHRDVSPHNVMISTDGTVKLLDFGIARAETEVMGGRLEGKIAYAAPEQLQGGLVDRRSDLWAVGIMMYELLCGFRPYEMASIDDILMVARQENFLRLEDTRPEAGPLSAIITQSLRFKKDNRWNDAESIINALQSAASSFVTVGPQELAELVMSAGGPTTSVLGVEQITSFGRAEYESAGTATSTLVREAAQPEALTPLHGQAGAQVESAQKPAPPSKAVSSKTLWITIASLFIVLVGFAFSLNLNDDDVSTAAIELDTPSLKKPIIKKIKKHENASANAESKPRATDAVFDDKKTSSAPVQKKEDTPSKAKTSRQRKQKSTRAQLRRRQKALRKKSEKKSNATAKQATSPSVKMPQQKKSQKQNETPRETVETRIRKTIGPGQVSVTSTPWANIEIDGQAFGVTPKLKIKLKPGRHELKLIPGDGQRKTAKVLELKVNSGQHIRIIADFSGDVFKILGQ